MYLFEVKQKCCFRVPLVVIEDEGFFRSTERVVLGESAFTQIWADKRKQNNMMIIPCPALGRGLAVDTIYLDLQKAFDTVPS